MHEFNGNYYPWGGPNNGNDPQKFINAFRHIVGVFRNGLTLMGVSSVYQILVTGVLVILAVATDQWSRRAT